MTRVAGRALFVLSLVPALAAGPGSGAPAVLTATAAAEKIGPELLALHEAYRQARRAGTALHFDSPLVRIVEDRVVIDAVASGDTRVLAADLAALGMRRATAFGRFVSGELPIAAIPELNRLGSLAFARAAAPGRSSAPRMAPRAAPVDRERAGCLDIAGHTP